MNLKGYRWQSENSTSCLCVPYANIFSFEQSVLCGRSVGCDVSTHTVGVFEFVGENQEPLLRHLVAIAIRNRRAQMLGADQLEDLSPKQSTNTVFESAKSIQGSRSTYRPTEDRAIRTLRIEPRLRQTKLSSAIGKCASDRIGISLLIEYAHG